MQAQGITLSEPQIERLERFEARYPGTRFDVTEHDVYSCAITVEADSLESTAFLSITATGRVREI